MSLNRLDYTIWGVLGGLGLALAGLLLAGDRIGARAVHLFPADHQTVSAYARIGIEFAQPMNAAATEKAFQLQPATPGQVRWEGQTLWFEPTLPLHPGNYVARLAGGTGLDGQPVKQPPVWSFTVRAPQLVFLSLVNGGYELGRVAAGDPVSPTVATEPAAPELLTHTQGRVQDFGVARDGEQIAYSVKNEQGGADLWLMGRSGDNPHLVVSCGVETCSAPAWAPDGSRLAYVREPAPASGQTGRVPRVWTLQPTSGQTAPLYQDPQVGGSEPTWSPDGRWLAIFDSQAADLRLLDVQTGALLVLPSLMGQVGSWSPDSSQLAFVDLKLGGAQIATQLQVADIKSKAIRLLVGTDRGWLDFGPPAWSPAGDWIAMSLRGATSGGPGKQIWLFHTDGSAAHPLTADADYGFGGYHWDPWGEWLVFQRYAANSSEPQPEIMLWSARTPEVAPRLVVKSAALATWLP